MNQTAFRSPWDLLRSVLAQGRACTVLRALIREEERAVGYERNDIRTKAKEWLIAHGSSLAAADVLLAQEHFGYLLPPDWARG
jgi:hypothetical protein